MMDQVDKYYTRRRMSMSIAGCRLKEEKEGKVGGI